MKPCPQCGEHRYLTPVADHRGPAAVYRVLCMHCGHEGPDAATEAKALDAWAKKAS